MKYFGAHAFDHSSFVAELDIDFVVGTLEFVVGRTHNQFHIHALIGYRTMTSSADADAWVLVQMHF